MYKTYVSPPDELPTESPQSYEVGTREEMKPIILDVPEEYRSYQGIGKIIDCKNRDRLVHCFHLPDNKGGTRTIAYFAKMGG